MKYRIGLVALIAASWLNAPKEARAEEIFRGDLAFGGFENRFPPAGWSFAGNAWIDPSWVGARASDGWNSLSTNPPVFIPRQGCEARVTLNGSSNVQNVFLSVIDPNTQQVLAERGPLSGSELMGFTSTGEGGFPAWDPWVPVSVQVPVAERPVAVRVGFWGNGQDAWVRISSLTVTCSDDLAPIQISL